MKKLSIVIPVFNEENFIGKTLERVLKVKTQGFNKEVIIIDDGSTDQTAAILKKLENKYKTQIKVFSQRDNQGKGAALKTGFLQSTGDIVIVQDADLEYDPSDYPILLEPFIKYKADVVYGSRLMSSRPHRVLYFWHFVSNVLLTTFSNMMTNLNLSDMETGFKVFRGDLIRRLAPNLESQRFGFEPEITAKIAKIKGVAIYEVGVSYSGRTYQEGKKIRLIDGIKALWEIVRFNLED
jgi:glycosyltransferase involved in cell wall biosynthesis